MKTVTISMKEYNSMKQQIGSIPRLIKEAIVNCRMRWFSYGVSAGVLMMVAAYLYF